MDEREIEEKSLTSTLLHMDDRENEEEPLTSRIEQLQHERDELRKDIEQLCLQQAGPSYLAVATRMHFQRTAGLEQEIENLQKKLARCSRDKQNLQEELSEAYQIKGQLADLHSAEVLKNKEAEKQLKFFQSCVAAAFSERDHALMESEKAKEREEAASERLVNTENRVEGLQSAYHEEKKLNADLQMELKELKEKNEYFEKVINKFYQIRERELRYSGNHTWQEKCSHLLDDSSDNWSFNSDSISISKYIASLEEELEKRKSSIDNLQSNLRMGLEIERHLKKKIHSLERKQVILVETIKNGLSALHYFHHQQKFDIVKILEEETSELKSVLAEVQEKLNHIHMNEDLKCEIIYRGHPSGDAECGDVHITRDTDSNVCAEKIDLGTLSVVTNRQEDASDTLVQALQEKVSALLLLSQQEESYLLERDVNQALQRKMVELQKNLSQVTNEKVQALMELAQLKQEYQLLQESTDYVLKHGKTDRHVSEKSISMHDQEGKLKNLLKRSYLKRWIGKGLSEHEVAVHANTDGSTPTDKTNIYPPDFARLKVESAALQESMANLEHLTHSIHRLRATLIKAQADALSSTSLEIISEALKITVLEANHVRTALGSSLPVSWSADVAVDAATYENLYEPTDPLEAVKNKVDPVSSAGLEMVELLILAVELLQDKLARSVD